VIQKSFFGGEEVKRLIRPVKIVVRAVEGEVGVIVG